uniref:Protein TsetseEP domain-containing protein n=1 Tax=Anopheles christyi TaxID=43041 RepID=A0A182JT28_9DIPT
MTCRSLLWFALSLAVLAINLQDASAQLDNAIVSKRTSINSTLVSFSNNIVSKVNDYVNKFTSLRNDMAFHLKSSSETLTQFLTSQDISRNAIGALNVSQQASATLQTNVTASIAVVANFSTIAPCINTKTQISINATFNEFSQAQAQFLTIVLNSNSPFLSTCRSRYSNTAQDLVNQAGDRVQDCLNDENNELSRVSWIINNFMTLIRQNYQSLGNHVRLCSSLGSASSRDEVRAEISACFKGILIYVGPIYDATIAQQFTLVNTMMQLEVVASNNRVKTCINQVTKTYTAMAKEIVPSLNQLFKYLNIWIGLQTQKPIPTAGRRAEYRRAIATTVYATVALPWKGHTVPKGGDGKAIGWMRLVVVWPDSNGSPDLGLDISIEFVTSNNPNIASAASMVTYTTSDLQGAIGGYQLPKLSGSTNLIASGEALISLVSNITVNVNDVLRNISTVANNRLTAPSCMFSNMNTTIDRAFVSLDEASTLIQTIQTSTSSQNTGTLTSWLMMIQTAMADISTYLDQLYTGVVKVLTSGQPLTQATITANIQQSIMVNLAGAISVVTTAEKGLTTTVRTIRSSFEQSGNILNTYSNDLYNALISVNNTQKDYYNQVVSRVNSYQGKITWEFGWGVTDIRNTLSRVNNFVFDQDTTQSAKQLNVSIGVTNNAIDSNALIINTSLQSQLTLLFTGVEAFIQSNVKLLLPVFDSSLFKLAATMSSGGVFASNCNSKYGGAITNLENNMRDGLQKCFNEYANTGYTDSFISEYNMVIREQTRSIANRINFCLNLGSSTSMKVIKMGIAACLTETIALSEALMKDVSIQSKLIVAMINLESLATVQRVESCAAILNHGLVAKAEKLDQLLATCQTTNQ